MTEVFDMDKPEPVKEPARTKREPTASNGQSAPQRSYGCSFGCGNPYDYVVVDVASSETLMLCLPDFVRMAGEMVAAVTDAGNPELARMAEEMGEAEQAPMRGDAPVVTIGQAGYADEDAACADCGVPVGDMHEPDCAFR